MAQAGSSQHRTIARKLRGTFAWGLMVASGWTLPVVAQEVATTGQSELQPGSVELDGQQRTVSKIELEYVKQVAGAPAIASLTDVTVQLAEVHGAWVPAYAGLRAQAVRLGDLGTVGPSKIFDSALVVISQAVSTALKDQGLVGVYAEPDTAQFRVEDGAVVDARAVGDTTLRILVAVGYLKEVRTIAQGERIEPELAVNNETHAWIAEHSPVQAASGGAVDRVVIDDYLFRLNRHPGRQVDAAVAPTGDEFGETSLDYLVTENRPWLLYAQATRDGRRDDDEWRYLFGFTHNQLTNADDVLNVSYRTSFDNVNTFSLSYERPVDDARRVRVRGFGSYYKYTSADVGQFDATFEGEGWNAGVEATYNFYQNADLFVDAVAGIRHDRIKVDNGFALVAGDESIVVGYVGARMERQRISSSTFGSAMLEFSIDGLDGDSVDTLGRFDADEEWATLKIDASHSLFIEPLLDRALEMRPGLAHELAFVARGQFSLGSRLAPNYQDVAGGLYTVRGYPDAVVAGDHALGGGVEYRFHLPRSFSPSERTGTFAGEPFRWRPQYPYGPLDWDLVLRSFIDVGYVQQVDRESFERDNTLVGAGFGAEFVIVSKAVVRADVGWALSEVEDGAGNAIVDTGDVQLHLVATFVY